MSDNELVLLCTPLRLKRPDHTRNAAVRVCALCGSQVYVSRPRVADVDSGRIKPRCLDHPVPADAVTLGALAPERALMRSLGYSEKDIDRADSEADKFIERMRLPPKEPT